MKSLIALQCSMLLIVSSVRAFAPLAFSTHQLLSQHQHCNQQEVEHALCVPLYSTQSDTSTDADVKEPNGSIEKDTQPKKVVSKAKNGNKKNGTKKNRNEIKNSAGKKKNGKSTKKNGKSKKKKKSPRFFKTKLLPLTDLKLGATVDGVIAAVAHFGVFVKINYDIKAKGTTGYALLHKSQIRDEPVDDPKKIFRVGNIVKSLRVININYAKGEVGLTLRKKRVERKSLKEFTVGEEYEGKISRIVQYGAFVDIGAKSDALLHISRINQKKITNVRQWVNEGDKVCVHIISKDEEKETMAASMLGKDADEYLNRRQNQLTYMKRRNGDSPKKKTTKKATATDDLKSEMEYFEDAVRGLDEALN